LEFFHFDGKHFRALPYTEIDLKAGTDPALSLIEEPLLRNETADKYGKFKFIDVPAGFYQVYSKKDGFFPENNGLISLGSKSEPMPLQYLLPHYSSSVGELWLRIKYN